MPKRTKAVGVRIGTLDDDGDFIGIIEWHAPPIGGTDYSTMCGVDADDPGIGHCGTVEPKPGQKITCSDCFTMWRDTIALKLRGSDFGT